MSASEERDLLDEYQKLTNFYAWAVGELSRQRGVVPYDSYQRLIKLVEEARTDCETAGNALKDFRNGNGNKTENSK